MTEWSIDNLYRFGEIVPGKYVILKDKSEVCYGTDPIELMLMVDTLNQVTFEQRVKALDNLPIYKKDVA